MIDIVWFFYSGMYVMELEGIWCGLFFDGDLFLLCVFFLVGWFVYVGVVVGDVWIIEGVYVFVVDGLVIDVDYVLVQLFCYLYGVGQ